MLRFFISLCLFVVLIEMIFCEESSNLGTNAGKYQIGISQPKRYKRQEVDKDDGEDQVAEIDLRDFIKDADDDYNPSSEIRHSDYSDYGSLDTKDIEENFRTDIENYENINNNMNSRIDNLLPNSIDARRTNLKHLSTGKVDRSENVDLPAMYHGDSIGKAQLTKKSILKKIRLPFFSLNKSNGTRSSITGDEKKSQCSKCSTEKPKDTKESETSLLKSRSNMEDSQEPSKYVEKRSYDELLCPNCRRRFRNHISSDSSSRNDPELIHNSRQFYHQYQNVLNSKSNERSDLGKETTNVFTNSNNFETKYYGKRKKREKDDLSDKDRQMKELDEVQRKIDSLEIKLPKYGTAKTPDGRVIA